MTIPTSLISNANLPSQILTRMHSLSASCPLEGVPGSRKYISVKFWTELQTFPGSSTFIMSWYATWYRTQSKKSVWYLCTAQVRDQNTTRYWHTFTCLLLFKTNSELSGERTGSKSFRILSCNKRKQCQWKVTFQFYFYFFFVFFGGKSRTNKIIMSPVKKSSTNKWHAHSGNK